MAQWEACPKGKPVLNIVSVTQFDLDLAMGVGTLVSVVLGRLSRLLLRTRCASTFEPFPNGLNADTSTFLLPQFLPELIDFDWLECLL